MKLNDRVFRFNQALIEAYNIHVGKVKPGTHAKPWITPTVKAAIKKRNRLRAKVRTHRAE